MSPAFIEYRSKCLRAKVVLLHLLFPIRIIICVLLAAWLYLKYQAALDEADKADNPLLERNSASGHLVCTVLFALTILITSFIGWIGVFKYNWALAVTFNALAILLLLIDINYVIFQIPIIFCSALIVTLIILFLNIWFAIDLNRIKRKYKEMLIKTAQNREKQAKIASLNQMLNTDPVHHGKNVSSNEAFNSQPAESQIRQKKTQQSESMAPIEEPQIASKKQPMLLGERSSTPRNKPKNETRPTKAIAQLYSQPQELDPNRRYMKTLI